MTEETQESKEDGGVREAHPLCQENQVLRRRLAELMKQLAESEGERIITVQNMNETKSELTRIRNETDSLKRVMSEISLKSYDGRTDPMEVDTVATMENSEVESTEGTLAPHVRGGMSCEGKGAADVHIADDVTTPQSERIARGDMNMTSIPRITIRVALRAALLDLRERYEQLSNAAPEARGQDACQVMWK
ncbi:hypothetical protein LTR49_024914 [Elasticomyces elasticus]|nr:hypothetical protein LTR49_024914 [Elasticomyces elasticus]